MSILLVKDTDQRRIPMTNSCIRENTNEHSRERLDPVKTRQHDLLAKQYEDQLKNVQVDKT
jgi:hypothetical protein